MNSNQPLHFLFTCIFPAIRRSSLPVIMYLAAIWMASGCANKITTRDVPVDLPESFSLPTGASGLEADWWKSFQDPQLNALIDTALMHNLELKSSWFQVAQEASNVAIIASERVPQVFLQLQSGASLPVPDFVGGENSQLSLRSNYEVDLWGRVKQSKMAADRKVAVAISNTYPRLVFNLTGALRSNTLTNLVESQAASLTGSLLMPLFYGGRL